MLIGIYSITCVINNKVYIGSSKDIEQRWRRHRSELNKGIHPNSLLLDDWKMYGEKAFEFKIIKQVRKYNKNYLLDLEIKYTKELRSNENNTGYNIKLGHSLSDKEKQRVSEVHKGKVVSQQTKQKLREVNLNKKLGKPVLQLDMEGNLIKPWNNSNQAQEAGFDPACISLCCRGKKAFYKGYKWEYIDK